MKRHDTIVGLALFAVIGMILVGCQPPSAPVAQNDRGTERETIGTPPQQDQIIEVALEDIGMTADGWYQNYEHALEEAAASNKVVLINFTGSDWCGWCHRLEDEVFSQEEFQQWANEKVVLLELDFPQAQQPAPLKQQNQELQRRFEVRGFPTILFLDSSGEVIGQSGYRPGGPEAWIEHAEEILSG